MSNEEMEIVGVSEDIRSASAPGEPLDAFFVPFGSVPVSSMTLLVRSRPFEARVAADIHRAAEEALPGQPVPDPAPLRRRVDEIHAEQRIFARLLGFLSAVGLLLAAAGLYAVVAFAVSARSRELGIRIALGAGGAHIARILLRHVALILGLGVGAGLVGALAISRVLADRLYGVEPLAVEVYAIAVATLSLVAIAASWLPLRSALRVDPAETLRRT
jgi:predicted lysophospholipase L1 biosynthesis ABC-type transport system permease subunit